MSRHTRRERSIADVCLDLQKNITAYLELGWRVDNTSIKLNQLVIKQTRHPASYIHRNTTHFKAPCRAEAHDIIGFLARPMLCLAGRCRVVFAFALNQHTLTCTHMTISLCH